MAEKDTRLNIRIDADLRTAFEKYCRSLGTTPSDQIRRYIVQLTKSTAK